MSPATKTKTFRRKKKRDAKMNKRTVLAASFTVMFLFSALAGTQFVRLAEANFMPMQIPQPAFIIRSDGRVDPPTAPIQRDGNVYTFTDDIVGYTIASERDNVVIDGGGYTLTGNGNSTAIFILNRNGITVRNMKISNFYYGIRLIAEHYMGMTSSNNKLLDNSLTNNEYGIYISSSSNNVLRNNSMNNNTRNFGVQGEYANDVDISNTVDGKAIIYWINQQDRIVPSDAGYVALVNCTHITVQNLNLANNRHGILLVSTTESTITKNHITNTGTGIYIQESSSNTISGNNLANNGYGINGQASSNNISSNNITNNENGLYFTGTSTSNTIFRNNITANTADGIHLGGSRNTDINENTITNNAENGIIFFESQDNRIIGNTITGNGNGIKLWFDANNNIVSDNYIANNAIGVLVDDSFDNRIIGNMITENSDWGMQLTGSQNNNVIYHNSFINNNAKKEGLQVSIPAYRQMGEPWDWLPGNGNVWDNGTAGNYWSDYITRYPNASEIGSSEIGDTPFYINENNFDRYPLVEPVTIPEFSSWALLCVMLVVVVAVTVVYRCNLNKHNQGTF
jgi:parallel beta-helix repeat protein